MLPAGSTKRSPETEIAGGAARAGADTAQRTKRKKPKDKANLRGTIVSESHRPEPSCVSCETTPGQCDSEIWVGALTRRLT